MSNRLTSGAICSKANVLASQNANCIWTLSTPVARWATLIAWINGSLLGCGSPGLLGANTMLTLWWNTTDCVLGLLSWQKKNEQFVRDVLSQLWSQWPIDVTSTTNYSKTRFGCLAKLCQSVSNLSMSKAISLGCDHHYLSLLILLTW